MISLNVGGVHYTTLKSTLQRYPDSMLAVMFSGRHGLQTDLHGAYFIDRNGTYFSHILDFLRLVFLTNLLVFHDLDLPE